MASRKTNLLKYEFFATKEGGSMFSDRYRASDYQNSWPNYHTLVKQEKLSLIDYHEEFEQAQTEW